MIDPGRVLILGAGPTGLGAAWRLQELGHSDWRVLEARAGPGGLASSVVDSRGFTWDLGGHVHFSHYADYDRVLDEVLGPEGWLSHARSAFVRLQGFDVPYPFQHNLHRLPESVRVRAIEGLVRAAGSDTDPSLSPDFAHWLRATFGAPLCELFFEPYNRKVWSHPLEDMGCSWVGERVALPDRERLEAQLQNPADATDWGPNRSFRFPSRGGTGAIWRAVCNRLPRERFRFGARAVELDPRARILRTAGDGALRFDTLISTVPLDFLVACWRGAPPEAVRAANRLRHNAVHLVGFGLEGPLPACLVGRGWTYFPEAHVPSYRVTVFSNYSSAHVPGEGFYSLLCEISSPAGAPSFPEDWGASLRGALEREGFVPASSRVCSLWQQTEPYGYPIPTKDRDRALGVLIPLLERYRIFSRGRFGAWKYEVSNQDHSFMQGFECVERLLGLGSERTLFGARV